MEVSMYSMCGSVSKFSNATFALTSIYKSNVKIHLCVSQPSLMIYANAFGAVKKIVLFITYYYCHC